MKELIYCKHCVMDGSAEEIVLDKDGVCNFCHQAQRELRMAKDNKINLGRYLKQIKGEKYDCLIGLSGGVDSSFTLHKAVKLGLKPLCFSIDNGWNDPKADENIMRIVETLKVPFFRYTIDKKRFIELQNAFILAGQKNIEIPTDHILMASSYEVASRYGIRWILSGGNVATEIIMPPSWGYNARDLVHIKDIYKWVTGKKLQGLPMCGLIKWNWYHWIKHIRIFYLLDFLDYNRAEAIKVLEKEYGYKDYGEKHCESVFTTWFQNFYLFQKFGIDKRKAHLSSLINSGQITRKEAQEVLYQAPVYPSLGIEDRVMSYQKRSYKEFKTDEKLWLFLGSIIRLLRGLLKK